MARPNFNLIATINRELRGISLSHHTVNSCQMPPAVRSQVEAGRRIWTWDDYDHAVNVSVRGYGLFEFRWNNNSTELDSIPRRWLATQVYYFKSRSKELREAA